MNLILQQLPLRFPIFPNISHRSLRNPRNLLPYAASIYATTRLTALSLNVCPFAQMWPAGRALKGSDSVLASHITYIVPRTIILAPTLYLEGIRSLILDPRHSFWSRRIDCYIGRSSTMMSVMICLQIQKWYVRWPMLIFNANQSSLKHYYLLLTCCAQQRSRFDYIK